MRLEAWIVWNGFEGFRFAPHWCIRSPVGIFGVHEFALDPGLGLADDAHQPAHAVVFLARFVGIVFGRHESERWSLLDWGFLRDFGWRRLLVLGIGGAPPPGCVFLSSAFTV